MERPSLSTEQAAKPKEVRALPTGRPILSSDEQAQVVFNDEHCEDSVEAQPRLKYDGAKLRKGKPFRKSRGQSRTLCSWTKLGAGRCGRKTGVA